MEVEGWVSVKRAATELGVSLGAVYGLIRRKTLEEWTIDDIRVIRRADLDAYQARRAGKGRPGPKPKERDDE